MFSGKDRVAKLGLGQGETAVQSHSKWATHHPSRPSWPHGGRRGLSAKSRAHGAVGVRGAPPPGNWWASSSSCAHQVPPPSLSSSIPAPSVATHRPSQNSPLLSSPPPKAAPIQQLPHNPTQVRTRRLSPIPESPLLSPGPIHAV